MLYENENATMISAKQKHWEALINKKTKQPLGPSSRLASLLKKITSFQQPGAWLTSPWELLAGA